MKTPLCIGTLLLAVSMASLPAADSAVVPATRVRLAQIVQRAAPQKADVFTFSGSVLDAEAKPVAGATVELYHGEANTMRSTEEPPLQSVTTGADGAFSLSAPAGSVLLVAAKPGMAPTWRTFWRVQESTTQIKLRLPKSTTLSGALSDEQGKPVPGAMVQASVAVLEVELEDNARSSSYLGGKRASELFQATTGSAGQFAFTNVSSGMSADFMIQKPGFTLRQQSESQPRLDSLRARAGQTNVQLVATRAGGLAGRVASDSDQGIAKARVTASAFRPGASWGGQPSAETAADGSFALEGLAPVDYRLTVNFGTNDPAEWVAETVSVSVEAGKTAVEKIVATKGGLIEAKVVSSEDGSPIVRAMVYISAEKFQIGRSTGKDGSVLVRVPAGELNVAASKDMSRTGGEKISVAAGETKSLELRLAGPPRIAGQVTDVFGKGIEGVQLRILPEWAGDLNVATDAEGKYSATWDRSRFSGMSDRQFFLVARHPGRNLAAAQEIADDAKTLNLQLKPALVITGRVETAAGKGIPEASVTTYFWAGNMGSSLDRNPVRTDSNGHYAITGLPQGCKYSVNATAKGYGSGSESLEAEATEIDHIELPAFALELANLKLSGRVVDSDEKPLPQVYVNMYGRGQPQGSMRTDENGAFHFEAVCAGDVQLSASVQTPGGGYGSARAQGGDTNILIQIGASGGYVSEEQPRRVSLKGKPLPDLATAGLGADKLRAEKPVLLCLFDAEQRPSRRFISQLSGQADALKSKGVTLAVLHVNPGGVDSFKEWKSAAATEVLSGCVADKNDTNLKWAIDVGTLPWLILTDKHHKVLAEGFEMEELEAKLQQL